MNPESIASNDGPVDSAPTAASRTPEPPSPPTSQEMMAWAAFIAYMKGSKGANAMQDVINSFTPALAVEHAAVIDAEELVALGQTFVQKTLDKSEALVDTATDSGVLRKLLRDLIQDVKISRDATKDLQQVRVAYEETKKMIESSETSKALYLLKTQTSKKVLKSVDSLGLFPGPFLDLNELNRLLLDPEFENVKTLAFIPPVPGSPEDVDLTELELALQDVSVKTGTTLIRRAPKTPPTSPSP